MRLVNSEKLIEYCNNQKVKTIDANDIARFPTVDAAPVVRCKNCKHRPTIREPYENGFDLDFPDERCPCHVEDGWYSWMPDDDWFCANGERKE